MGEDATMTTAESLVTDAVDKLRAACVCFNRAMADAGRLGLRVEVTEHRQRAVGDPFEYKMFVVGIFEPR
jgi:hypothetical protein